jgi:hypothetical protein
VPMPDPSLIDPGDVITPRPRPSPEAIQSLLVS